MTNAFLLQLPAVATPVAVVVASLLLGLFLRRTLLARLATLAKMTDGKIDDQLVASLKRPLPVWCVLGGIYVAEKLTELSDAHALLFEKGLLSLFILSITFWAADLGTRLIQTGAYSDRPGAPTPGVIRYVVKIAVVGLGILVLLSTLGISITPVLTTLGIGGLAVALGLQDTLSNLFAGIQITLGHNMNVGDFIKLESGEEGYIEDILWRGTRVRTPGNNAVLIPNSRLAQSVVTNYHMPSKDLSVSVELGVHYSSDLVHVERVVLDVARSVLKTYPGGCPDSEPAVRFHTFGESSIRFTVGLQAREFAEVGALKHEFIKAIVPAFRAEHIVIPAPVRAINTRQESASAEISERSP